MKSSPELQPHNTSPSKDIDFLSEDKYACASITPQSYSQASRYLPFTTSLSQSKQRSILIIGGGTFDASTAYHRSEKGYTNVTVFDRWATISKEAAGNNINKVIQADYPEILYAILATESINEWRDTTGLFAGLYHRYGWLITAGDKSLPFIEGSIKTAGERGFEEAQPVISKEVNQRWPAYDGPMAGWKTYWNSSAGWANAREALKRMADGAQKFGVRYVSGHAGHVVRLLFDSIARCVGVQGADGATYFADEIILAAGAAAASIFDLKGQSIANGHTVGHIQLQPEEVEKYAKMPIVDHLERGNTQSQNRATQCADKLGYIVSSAGRRYHQNWGSQLRHQLCINTRQGVAPTLSLSQRKRRHPKTHRESTPRLAWRTSTSLRRPRMVRNANMLGRRYGRLQLPHWQPSSTCRSQIGGRRFCSWLQVFARCWEIYR